MSNSHACQNFSGILDETRKCKIEVYSCICERGWIYLPQSWRGGVDNVTQEEKWFNLPKLGFPAVRLPS